MVKKVILIIAIIFSFSNFADAGQKNVILIIPDGCSVGMWASIRAITIGGKGVLNVDSLPVQGRCSTCSANALITDSAASATAYACGVKTGNGVLGMDAHTVRGDSVSGKKIENIIEIAKKNGYATGIVTTTLIQHATPAAFYTHRPERDWYALIAGDLVGKGIDVVMGGGRENMIPANTKDNEGAVSKRKDNRSIIDEMKSEGYEYVFDRKSLDELDTSKTKKVLGLFNPGHMDYEYDRKTRGTDDPPIWEMAEKAIEILSNSKKGFFLIIEAGRIDHAAHDHDTLHYLWEGIACDKMIGVAKDFAVKNKNTLLVVVPDHGNGSPGLVGINKISGTDTTLVSGEDAGFPLYRLDADGFPIWDGGMPIAIQWTESKGHSGEDVTLSAMGPSSEKLDGYFPNTKVFAGFIDFFDFKDKKTLKFEDIVDF